MVVVDHCLTEFEIVASIYYLEETGVGVQTYAEKRGKSYEKVTPPRVISI